MKRLFEKENEKSYNKIPGGKGDMISIDDVDENELAVGIEVEMEHTNDRKIATEIALDHLSENPDYYSELLNKTNLVDEPKAIEKAKEVDIYEHYFNKMNDSLNEDVVDKVIKGLFKRLKDKAIFRGKSDIVRTADWERDLEADKEFKTKLEKSSSAVTKYFKELEKEKEIEVQKGKERQRKFIREKNKSKSFIDQLEIFLNYDWELDDEIDFIKFIKKNLNKIKSKTDDDIKNYLIRLLQANENKLKNIDVDFIDWLRDLIE